MKAPRRSLIEHFAPPAGMVGRAGWVCGFSADERCLDAVVESFTDMGRTERAQLGRTSLGLILDPGHRQILPGSVHGVHQLPLKATPAPFRLMHAKVALLGFHERDDPTRWMVRLLVTTGNWTRQTLEDSIDLAWRIELTGDEARVRRPEDDVDRRRADIRAATSFLDHLRSLYDDTPLTVAEAEQGQPFADLASWLSSVGRARARPRFVDTRRRSLLGQLPDAASATGTARRNRLVLGSGFWEGGTPGLPKVPARIIGTLQDKALLTSQPKVWLVVEPDNCATLAEEETKEEIDGEGWTLLLPRQPHEHVHRHLHAKFIFCANERGGEACTSAWFYLGSGNLTPAGFLRKAGPNGNLEAGVVASAEGKMWGQHGRSKWDDGDIRHVLPIDWKAVVRNVTDLRPGDPLPDREDPFLAAPISYLLWEPLDEGGALVAEAVSDRKAVDVLDASGSPCPREAGRFLWAGARPVHAIVRWTEDGEERTSVVPVIDEFGRLAAVELEPVDVETAIDMLLSFPAAGAVDPELVEEEPEPAPGGAAGGGAAVEAEPDVPKASRRVAEHHVRRLMLLVERIADRQTNLHDFAWTEWCRRLECVLSQVAFSARRTDGGDGDPALAFVRGLGINPLAPLRQAPFLPDHAMPDSDGYRRLDRALDRVEGRWGVRDLEPLGGTND